MYVLFQIPAIYNQQASDRQRVPGTTGIWGGRGRYGLSGKGTTSCTCALLCVFSQQYNYIHNQCAKCHFQLTKTKTNSSYYINAKLSCKSILSLRPILFWFFLFIPPDPLHQMEVVERVYTWVDKQLESWVICLVMYISVALYPANKVLMFALNSFHWILITLGSCWWVYFVSV